MANEENDTEKATRARAVERILEESGILNKVPDSELAHLRDRAVKAKDRGSTMQVPGDVLVRLIDEVQWRRSRR